METNLLEFLPSLAGIAAIWAVWLKRFEGISFKHKKFDEQLEIAKAFYTEYIKNSDINSVPLLVKDRAAQQLVRHEGINYQEVIYFLQFINFDNKIKHYMNCRDYLDIDQQQGKIVNVRLKNTPTKHKIKKRLFLMGYFILAFIAILPLMYTKFYLNQIDLYWGKLMIFPIFYIVVPIVCAFLAFACLAAESNMSNAEKLLKNMRRINDDI